MRLSAYLGDPAECLAVQLHLTCSIGILGHLYTSRWYIPAHQVSITFSGTDLVACIRGHGPGRHRDTLICGSKVLERRYIDPLIA